MLPPPPSVTGRDGESVNAAFKKHDHLCFSTWDFQSWAGSGKAGICHSVVAVTAVHGDVAAASQRRYIWEASEAQAAVPGRARLACLAPVPCSSGLSAPVSFSGPALPDLCSGMGFVTLQQKKRLAGGRGTARRPRSGIGRSYCGAADSYSVESFKPSRVHSGKPAGRGCCGDLLLSFSF